MKRKMAVAAAIACFALAGGSLFAEGLEFNFKGIALNWAVKGLTGLPVPTGADLQFGLPVASIEGQPLTLVARLRGGWEDGRILRNAATGDPCSEPGAFDASNGYRYYMPNFQWALGATQGLVQKDKGNLVEAFAFYRGRCDIYQTSLGSSVFEDMGGIAGTSFLAGAAYDSTASDSRRVIRGAFAEGSFEYGPGILNTGSAGKSLDFWRVDLKARGYYPLMSEGQASNEGLNLFSLYLAGFASVDYAGGNNVPIWVMQSFGGRDLRGSLGDCVRGYPSNSYDSAFKAVANGEVRALLPALAGQAWLVPMAYAFCDLGYYDGFAGSANYADASGVIASAGAGLNVDLLDFVNVGAYAGCKVPAGSKLYSVYTDDGNFFWNFQFLLHF